MADRKYGTAGRPGLMAGVPPMVRRLLLANVGIYLLDILLKAWMYGDSAPVMPPLREWGAFSISTALGQGRVWEFVTFQFLHGHVLHLVANSIGLFFFGPWMERWWGSRRFLAFYLISGAAGAAFFTLLVLLGLLPRDLHQGLVGASAGIYAILIGVAFIAPGLRVSLLFPPVTLTMRQLAIALLVIATGAVLLKLGGNEGGEAGHLGGAIAGYLLMRRPQWLRWFGGKSGTREAGGGPWGRGGGRGESTPPEPKLRPRSSLLESGDDEVDAILDKISRDGFQSLSEAERELLRRAASRSDDDNER